MITRYKTWYYHLFLSLFVLFASVPLIILLMNSVKSNIEVMGQPLSFPSVFRLRNYAEAWQLGKYTRAYLNSIIVTGSSIIVICVASGFVAFALANFRFPGITILTFYFLASIVIPPQVYIVPLFVFWRKLGLVNSLLGIVLIYSAVYLPVSIFLLRAYFQFIPKELYDAARIDGCSSMKIFWSVTMPLARSAYIVIIVRIAYLTWNEYLFAVTFLQTEASQIVPIRYLKFTGAHFTYFAYVCSGGIISIVPIVVLFILLQNKFIEGLSKEGLK